MARLDVVTIDGPAGAGKSTVARRLAIAMGYGFLDTGAMYRAVAFMAIKHHIRAQETNDLGDFLKNLQMRMKADPQQFTIWIDDTDVSRDIREPHMGKAASDFSALKSVRDYCVRLQQMLGEKGHIVAEGRDMGSVVFPNARWKYYLTAGADERAMRRLLQETGQYDPELFNIRRSEIIARDNQDMNRTLSPLIIPEGAVMLDTSSLTIDQVVSLLVADVKKKREQLEK
jgi:CMP/dCMP kinase